MLNVLEVDRARIVALEAEISELELSLGPSSPTLLTRICHKWREIALANPLLWRAILLSNDIPREHRLHIARACPLSIHIDDNNDPMPVSEIFNALSTHCAYWEHLKVEASFFPAIETPLLRTVILNGATSKIILPWAQLTSLTLTSVFPHECLPILQKTSTLVHCDLRLFAWPYDHTNITLPYLESLALECLLGEGSNFITGLIDAFTVIALRSLQISEHGLGPNPIDSLISFFSKSGCKLQELRITGERSVTQESYREAFPSIGTLSFSHDDEEDSE
ncbi:hypothetical protein B0H13DRAFT_1993508, partial [Mycena leptocephala]